MWQQRPAATGAWLLLFTCVAKATASAVPSPSLLVKDVQYGDEAGLDIGCASDELILIESETLAYSGGGGWNSSLTACRPEPQCSVRYSQASWYCRGRSTCTGMMIERQPLHRRTCRTDYTDCLRVEYQCVKSTISTVSIPSPLNRGVATGWTGVDMSTPLLSGFAS